MNTPKFGVFSPLDISINNNQQEEEKEEAEEEEEEEPTHFNEVPILGCGLNPRLEWFGWLLGDKMPFRRSSSDP